MEINNPYDLLFKGSFSKPELAKSFFKKYLPADIRDVLDLDTLHLEKDTFIST